MTEEIFKTGALPDPKDDRDYMFEALGSAPLTDEEWAVGFDIEKVAGFTIPVKNQFISYSCVGQAKSYYWALLQGIARGSYKEISAKSIYALIALGNNQGAFLRDGSKTIKEVGALWEHLLKSYKSDGTTDEAHMTDKSWFNDDMREIMALLRAYDYYRVTDFSIDGFAKAIRDGYGMVAGVTGTNNGSWTSAYPIPPTLSTPQNQLWGHALYFGKFRIKNGKKEVGCLNSWGNIGENGWQWLTEDWFKDNGRWVFNPWVLVNKINNMSNETAKILKDKNSAAVGIWLPAISEDVLKSYALNMGKTIPMKDGKIDWEKAIEGEFEFKK